MENDCTDLGGAEFRIFFFIFVGFSVRLECVGVKTQPNNAAWGLEIKVIVY